MFIKKTQEALIWYAEVVENTFEPAAATAEEVEEPQILQTFIETTPIANSSEIVSPQVEESMDLRDDRADSVDTQWTGCSFFSSLSPLAYMYNKAFCSYQSINNKTGQIYLAFCF